MISTFSTTPRILMGPGAAEQLGHEVQALHGSRVMIVTDKGVMNTGIVKGIEISLVSKGIGFSVFDAVEADPSFKTVEACVKAARNENTDLLIGLGGGSPMDIAKVTSVMMTNDGHLPAYLEGHPIPEPGLPTILVPTTAGTGSEVTPIAILSDEDDQLKKGLVSPYLYPRLAIVDPVLTLDLPPHMTAATGMDALIHAMEAYTSIRANDITDMISERAIELIYKNIRMAYARGHNLKARSAMMTGSLLAGIAFANAGVTAVHAFAYPIGARFHIPHGIANTLMLPHVFRFNMMGNPDKFAAMAKPLGLMPDDSGRSHILDRIIQTLESLINDLGLSRSLREFGIEELHLDSLANDVLKVTRLLSNNPRTVGLDDADRIYRAAL